MTLLDCHLCLPQGRILNENDAHEPARAALCGPGHQKLDQIHGQAAVDVEAWTGGQMGQMGQTDR